MSAEFSEEHQKTITDFVHKYYNISNTRPDLLYRLYCDNSVLKVSETVRGKRKSINASASGPDEIRFLLSCILDKTQTTVISLTCQNSTRSFKIILVTGLLKHEASRLDHFFTQTFELITSEESLTISSGALQIFSHNLKRNLMSCLQSSIKDSRIQVEISYPPVIDAKIRSRVCKEHRINDDEVGSLFKEVPSPCGEDRMKGDTPQLISEKRIDTDTAREAVSENCRAHGWDSFAKGRPVDYLPEKLLDDSKDFATEVTDALLDTPWKPSGISKGLFLSCLGDSKKQENLAEAMPQSSDGCGSYLRLFGFKPIPDGSPVEWDLSQDAVFTQTRTYHDTMDRLQQPVPKRRSRSFHSKVDWHQRTVCMDNLPSDINPDSLRRAFETMFGEIEDENGIMIVSTQRSSIAFVVFKSYEAAREVGLADSWVNGSKITIQKYRSPFDDLCS